MQDQDRFDPTEHIDGLRLTDMNGMGCPARVEAAYRRGFAQGAALAFYAAQDGVRLSKIKKWIFDDIWKWRYEWRNWKTSLVKAVMPPDPPKISQNTASSQEPKMQSDDPPSK